MRQPSGLLSTILIRTVPVAVLLLLAISLGANLLSERTVRREVEDRLLGESATQALVISLTLGTLVDSTKTLAVNELIIDGVVDTWSRPAYLEPLFRSLQIPGPPVRLTMSDNLGSSIATNSGESVSYLDEPWIDQVLSGEQFVDLTQSGLTIAVPVMYLGIPRGMMVMEAGPATVAGIVGSGLAASDGMLLDSSGEVIISSVPGSIRTGDIDPGKDIDGWLQQRAAVPGFPDHTLVTMETENQALGPVRQVRKFLWAAIGLDLLVLVAAISLTARLATKPVAALAGAVSTIRGDANLRERVPQTGPRELQELGQAFNATLGELQKTMNEQVQTEAENARLQEEIRLTAELEARLRTFVSLASHELRTPTTSIMGFAELLLTPGTEDEEDKQEWLAIIHRNSVLLAGIVSDLLDVTRIQSGTLTLKKEEVSLANAVEEALTSIRTSTDQHDFPVEIPQTLPPVIADYDKLNQILTNLLGNAVKYSPTGGKVSLSAVDDSLSGRVVISIRDEGVGIAPEDQDMLFTPFVRIHTPETANIDGSGLGLYLVKELLAVMGGEVWFEKQAGTGSTFSFYLPTTGAVASSKVSPAARITDGGDSDAVGIDS